LGAGLFAFRAANKLGMFMCVLLLIFLFFRLERVLIL